MRFAANVPEEIFKDGQPFRDGMMIFILKEMGAEMNFKIGDRVKVSTIEDVGTVQEIDITSVLVRWNRFQQYWYPAYQVRLAEESTRLSRKEIRKELRNLIEEFDTPYLMSYHIVAVCDWIKVSKLEKRKEIRARLRQLSAEAYCIDKVLAERIDLLADKI